MVRCGPRRVPAVAFDLDGQAVGGRHQGPRADRELADRQPRIIVHPVDFLDAEAVHQAVLHHGLAAGAALLGRLKDHHRGAGEIARLGQIARRAQQHRGMPIMAAGVHLARHGRAVGHLVRFLDRQRIHVGAQPDHLAGRVRAFAAVNDAHHPGASDSGHHLVAAEALELLGHRSCCAMDVVKQLGMGVKVAPPGGDIAVQVGDTIDDRHQVGSGL